MSPFLLLKNALLPTGIAALCFWFCERTRAGLAGLVKLGSMVDGETNGLSSCG